MSTVLSNTAIVISIITAVVIVLGLICVENPGFSEKGIL